MAAINGTYSGTKWINNPQSWLSVCPKLRDVSWTRIAHNLCERFSFGRSFSVWCYFFYFLLFLSVVSSLFYQVAATNRYTTIKTYQMWSWLNMIHVAIVTVHLFIIVLIFSPWCFFFSFKITVFAHVLKFGNKTIMNKIKIRHWIYQRIFTVWFEWR